MEYHALPIGVSGGIDTSTDPRMVAAPKTLRCENWRFFNNGGLIKRRGYRKLGRTFRAWDGNGNPNVFPLDGLKFLSSRQNELIAGGYPNYAAVGSPTRVSGTPSQGIVASYDAKQDDWVDRGALDCPTVIYSPLRLGFQGVSHGITVGPIERVDFIEANGYRFVAWCTGALFAIPQGVWGIFDIATDALLQSDTFVGTSPRWVIVGSSVHLYHHTGTTGFVKVIIFSPSSIPQAGQPPIVTVASDAITTVSYGYVDAIRASGNRALVSYRQATGIRFGYVNEAGAFTSTVTITTNAGVGHVAHGISVGPTGTVAVCWLNEASSTNLFVNTYAAETLINLQTKTIATGASGTAIPLNASAVFTSSTLVAVFASVSDAGTFIRTYRITLDAVSGATTIILVMRNQQLASKPWVDDDGITVRVYMIMPFQGNANLSDVTYVTIGVSCRHDSASLIDAQVVPFAYVSIGRDTASGQGQVNQVVRDGTARRWRWLGVAFPGTFFTPSSGSLGQSMSILITHDFTVAPVSIEVGRSNVIAGAINLYYDGRAPIEIGFLTCPNRMSAASSNAAGSMTSSATYSYKAYWEWTDVLGQVARSTFGAVTTITLGGTDNTVTLTLTSLATGTTRKPSAILGIYRAGPNPTSASNYNRVSSVNPADLNATNGYILAQADADTITFVDKMADLTAAARPLDYVTGGVQPNVAPGGGSVIGHTDERIFLAGTTDDPNNVIFSKLRGFGEPIDFSPGLSMQVGEVGGGINAIGVLNDYIVFFKPDAIYVSAGDGPNNTLSAGSFQAPKLVSADAGCTNAASLVRTPLGLMFQSRRWFYLLDTSLSLRYIGAPSEFYRNLTVTAAQVVAEESQVRWLTSTGECIVYDYNVDAWGVYTNHQGQSSCRWQGAYTFLTAGGEVWTQSNGFTDPGIARTAGYPDGQHIRAVVETSWQRMGGIQPAQKARRVHVLGECRSPFILRVSAAFDYEDSFVETHELNTAAAGIRATFYGDGAFYGSNLTYGSSDTLMQATTALEARFKLNRMKCEAVRFRVEDIAEGGVPGESFELTALSLEVGVDPGKLFNLRNEASG